MIAFSLLLCFVWPLTGLCGHVVNNPGITDLVYAHGTALLIQSPTAAAT